MFAIAMLEDLRYNREGFLVTMSGKVVPIMEEERDVVVFSDDEGNEFELDVIDYFEHEGQEYAILMDLSDSAEDECECEGECDDEEFEDAGQQDVYIMKVVVNGDVEEFLPADEELMDVLSAIVEKRLSEDCDCGCEGGECGCDGGECGCD